MFTTMARVRTDQETQACRHGSVAGALSTHSIRCGIRMKSILVALVASLSLAGCDIVGPSCDGNVKTTLDGDRARFDWSSSCRVAEIEVRDLEWDLLWWVESESRLRAPVTYGVPPSGGSVVFGPGELMPETSYMVMIIEHSGERRK